SFMDLLNLLSWACIVFTVGMFSTGLTDIKKMQQSKSVENIQFLPFLTTCLNNLGWLYYGILKSDQTLILVNVIGAVLQILYIVMYFGYATEKNAVASQTLTAGIILFCASACFYPRGETQLSQLGLTCSVFTVSMYLSPLSSLVEVVRSRNVQCLSFPLTVATLLTSASWVLYGLQVSDLYIVVPNTPGIITSLIRFYLFWKFGPSSQGSPSYKPIHI
uniref:Sugar transporter SWEET1 n=1 Tax=Tetraodon nigroviridis TaxID=99883 RepID=H3DLU7_TETNG